MEDDDSGSYHMAVSPPLPDDGLTSEGKPRAIRYKKQILNELNQDMQLEEHKLTVEEICELLQTDPEFGLMNVQAKAILDRDGPNVINLQPQSNKIVQILSCLFGGSCSVLWLCVVLLLVIQMIEDQHRPADLSDYTPLCTALLLILITLASAAFRFFEELQTERLLQQLQQPPPSTQQPSRSNSTSDFTSEQPLCVVVREANRITVPITELVAGDLLELRANERLPADVRLIKSAGLKVDCAELTGDSSLQSRTADYSADSAFEAKNLCFAGSMCTEGEGTGVVIATGPRTVAARLQTLADNQPERQTPTILHLRKFISKSLCFPLNGSLLLFPVAMALGFTWLECCILLLGLVLAILPQSLLCIANACFQLAVRRMAARLCLVREPAALEALGHCDLMLLDKTGTLTQNRLTVVHFWFGGRLETAQLSEEQTGAHRLTRQAEFLPLELAATLCNSARFAPGQTSLPVQKRRVLSGNEIESALLKCMELIHDQSEQMRSEHPRRLQLPFSNVSKVHVTIHELNLHLLLRQRPQLAAFYPTDHGAGPNLLLIKGAPEKILDRCSSWIHNERERTLTLKDRQILNQAYAEMCRRAERVVAFADLWLSGARFPSGYEFDSSNLNFPLVGLRFLGFISMHDPPRPDVCECVTQLHRSGLRLVMVTGDHAITAKALARSVGLVNEVNETVEEIALRTAIPVQQVDRSASHLIVLSGAQLHEITNDQLDRLMSVTCATNTNPSNELIFARLEPAQKLRVVESAQRVGLVVAGVGDGVNDLPMLKRCDVSICIGSNELVQRHSQIIILDGSFASVLHALKQARTCTLSLRRAIAFAFCANAPQTVAFLVCLLFGLPLPLSIGTLVLIDLAIDMLPAIGLCYEQVEEGQSHPTRSTIDKLKPPLASVWPKRLIDSSLLSFAWLQIGAVQAAAGLFAYFVIMAQNGFWMSNLFYLRQQWDSMAINDLKDSVGQEWDYEQRKRLEFTCQTGFFFTVVACQWVTAIVCKTRTESIFTVKMINDSLNFALIFEFLLVLALIYGPGTGRVLNLYSLCFSWLFIPFPFVLIIFGYDELRKYILRKNPGGWVQKELFY